VPEGLAEELNVDDEDAQKGDAPGHVEPEQAGGRLHRAGDGRRGLVDHGPEFTWMSRGLIPLGTGGMHDG